MATPISAGARHVTIQATGLGVGTGPQGPQGEQGLPGLNGVPTDEAVAAYIGTPGTDIRGALDAWSPAVPLRATGIDPSGVADSTAAVNTFLAAQQDGSTIEVPPGAVINLQDQVLIAKRLHLRGAGELRFTAGVAQKAAILVTADGAKMSGLTITNPNELGEQTGGKNIGIEVRANNVTIDSVTIDRFQNGVANSATGEFEGVAVRGCHITNVVGAGDGPGPGTNGEDRGDGITLWGARCIATGNIVSAKPGTDARIGIHAEGLGVYAVDPGDYEGSLCAIANNVVSGKFRRGIVVEDINNATITGNVVSDSTWWGIAVIYGVGATVSGNSIRWTATEADTQGEDWSPLRGPIMIYHNATAVSVAGNTIDMRGVASAAIRGRAISGAGPIDLAITGNVVTINGGTCATGIAIQETTRAIVQGNRISTTAATGAQGGIISAASNGTVVSGNSLLGASTANGYGVRHEGAQPISILDNSFSSYQYGVACINSTSGVSIVGNSFANCLTAIDTFGSTGRSIVALNRFVTGVTTQHANASTNMAFLTTRHVAGATPTGGSSGDILVGTGKIWVNDAGTWKSATLT